MDEIIEIENLNAVRDHIKEEGASRVIATFFQFIEPTIQTICEAMAQGDMDTLRATVHKLGSRARGIHARKLYEECTRIEGELNKNSVVNIKTMIEDLSDLVNETIVALTEYQSRL
jgi:HPt (histidine-containing phosphotransfer) domain-containing protein